MDLNDCQNEISQKISDIIPGCPYYFLFNATHYQTLFINLKTNNIATIPFKALKYEQYSNMSTTPLSPMADLQLSNSTKDNELVLSAKYFVNKYNTLSFLLKQQLN